MRKFILAFALALTSFFAVATPSPELKANEHKATHTIVMLNNSNHQGAGCSATAISEHVLLTAAHCDIADAVLYIDQTSTPRVHPLEISDKIYDHQDHMLLVIPGVSFKYTIKYDPAVYKPLTINDRYYLWGNPGLIPDQYREGYVTGSVIPIEGLGEVDVYSPFI